MSDFGGLAAAAWAPCRVETTIRFVPLRVDVETDYPFRDRVDFFSVVRRERFLKECPEAHLTRLDLDRLAIQVDHEHLVRFVLREVSDKRRSRIPNAVSRVEARHRMSVTEREVVDEPGGDRFAD